MKPMLRRRFEIAKRKFPMISEKEFGEFTAAKRLKPEMDYVDFIGLKNLANAVSSRSVPEFLRKYRGLKLKRKRK